MNRPTCGTCPHCVNGACFLQPAEWQDADSGPPVSETRPGCQHHPDMPDWVAQQRQPVQQPQSRADWRSNSRPEYPSQVEAVRSFIGAPTWQQAREKRERQAQSGQQQAAAPEQLAELEQWRKEIAWFEDSIANTWTLCVVRTAKTLSYVMPAGCEWLMSIDNQRYSSRDAAMRAAEAALGLPKCRVEGEP